MFCKCGEDLTNVKVVSKIGKNGKPWSAKFCPSCKEPNWIVASVSTFAPKAPQEKPKEKQEESQMLALITELKELNMCINELIKVLSK